MREIVFRGKIMLNAIDRIDKWCHGSLVKKCGREHDYYVITAPFSFDDPIMNTFIVDAGTVGQYTGRADVAGHPVFEGDIINCPGTEDAVGVVRFGDHPPHVSYLEGTGTGFYIDWQGDKYHGLLRSDIGYWLDHAESAVIGNIYDDPERLEV